MGFITESIDAIKRFGPLIIVPPLVVGSVIWAVSDYSAKPGSSITVLWGMVAYTKNGDATGAGCKSMQGIWFREFDRVTIELRQDGCEINGNIPTGVANRHEIHGAVYGNKAKGYAARVVDGCITYLAYEFEVVDSENKVMKLKEYGSGCDLNQYSREYLWKKI